MIWPILEARAELQKICIGANENFKIFFRDLLTFMHSSVIVGPIYSACFSVSRQVNICASLATCTVIHFDNILAYQDHFGDATVVLMGNGELGFDSREGAWETATTSTEDSGTRITRCSKTEVVTKNNDTGLFRGPVIGMSTL